jgi:hypothetical protein
MALLEVMPEILPQAHLCKGVKCEFSESPLLAEDCLLWGFLQRRLWRKQSLKLDEPAAKNDPQETLNASA